MTRADIIKLAQKAWGEYHEIFWFDDDGLEHFAALVAAAEREECAQVVDAILKSCVVNDVDDPPLADVAAAIRARGDA